ncbi:MAG: ROK family protein [Nitriliruptoraceae bacterium]|nr:ROK family protein [Nitriliruptoraceae bacterium]
MHDAIAIGIDIGGTRLRLATLGDDGAVLGRDRRPTPDADGQGLIEVLVEAIGRTPAELPVGIGIAGLVTPDGTYRYGPNLTVRELPLATELTARTGRTVVVANDASVAAFAEQRVGAGRGVSDVVMATIGTGVGGGVVLGGELLLGAGGFAGELGHVIVAADGRPCPCGNKGCIEAYASGTAIGAVARERLSQTDAPSSLRDRATVAGPDVSAAAGAGDVFAQQVLTDAGRWLGIALASLTNALDPGLVLLGGGAAEAIAPWALPAARTALAERLLGRGHRRPPPVELAQLGDDAGVVGAGLLAAERATAR